MSYLDQVNRAIDVIEDNLCSSLPLESIAKEAGLSKWYFQKIFRGMVGDTVKEYILKRRLSLAARALIDSNQKVIDIAIAYGFDSHEVFTRAFKRVFNTTPTEFRNSNSAQSLIPHKPQITLAYLTHLYERITMQPTIKYRDEATAMGMVAQFKSTLNSDSDNLTVIPALWQEFKMNLKKIPNGLQAQRVAIMNCSDKDELSNNMEYLAGILTEAFEELPMGFVQQTIPAGNYAEFTHRGPMKNIEHTMNYIYGSWLPKSGHERSAGPDVGIYPKDFDPNSSKSEIKLLIPLK